MFYFLFWGKRHQRSKHTINLWFFLIIFFIEEIAWFIVIRDFYEPGIFCILVDQSGIFLDFSVDSQHFASHRSIDICCYLNTLNDDWACRSLQSFADRWEFDVNNFSKLLLSVVGDTDFGYFLFRIELNPLVTFSVFSGWTQRELLAKNLRRANKDLICYLYIFIIFLVRV